MADACNAEIIARVGYKWTTGHDDEIVDDESLKYSEKLADGSGDNQVEGGWSDLDATLLDGASVTYDLTTLSRTVFGDTVTVTFATVKALQIVNTATSGGRLIIGAAAANEWSAPFGSDGDTLHVELDSPVLLGCRKAGWDVDATNKNLKLTASGGDVTYSITIVGTITGGGSSS